MIITVSIPDENMGDIIGDLSSRRGKVLGSDSTAGVTEVKAHVPHERDTAIRPGPEFHDRWTGFVHHGVRPLRGSPGPLWRKK